MAFAVERQQRPRSRYASTSASSRAARRPPQRSNGSPTVARRGRQSIIRSERRIALRRGVRSGAHRGRSRPFTAGGPRTRVRAEVARQRAEHRAQCVGRAPRRDRRRGQLGTTLDDASRVAGAGVGRGRPAKRAEQACKLGSVCQRISVPSPSGEVERRRDVGAAPWAQPRMLGRAPVSTSKRIVTPVAKRSAASTWRASGPRRARRPRGRDCRCDHVRIASRSKTRCGGQRQRSPSTLATSQFDRLAKCNVGTRPFACPRCEGLPGRVARQRGRRDRADEAGLIGDRSFVPELQPPHLGTAVPARHFAGTTSADGTPLVTDICGRARKRRRSCARPSACTSASSRIALQSVSSAVGHRRTAPWRSRRDLHHASNIVIDGVDGLAERRWHRSRCASVRSSACARCAGVA